MSSVLQNKVLKTIKKGNTSAYYSYLNEDKNPVIQQLEKELNDFTGFVKKKRAGLLKEGEHPSCKVSDALFEIWSKFEPRIPCRLFYEKLMQVGEFLVQNKEYKTAAWQCYDRYLNSVTTFNIEHLKSIEELRSHFFNGNVEQCENSDVTFRALMGHCICMYHFTIVNDPKLQNVNSIEQLTIVLNIIRLVMLLQLETDHFCWLVYNATIYIYTMGRYMMQYGLSKIVN
jgi:hypothetical protein